METVALYGSFVHFFLISAVNWRPTVQHDELDPIESNSEASAAFEAIEDHRSDLC